jgi:hypothetical protein
VTTVKFVGASGAGGNVVTNNMADGFEVPVLFCEVIVIEYVDDGFKPVITKLVGIPLPLPTLDTYCDINSPGGDALNEIVTDF